jgi:hypothetical protein
MQPQKTEKLQDKNAKGKGKDNSAKISMAPKT